MAAERSFTEKLAVAQDEAQSLLCVGIDPDPGRLPKGLNVASDPFSATREFCLQIVKATAPFASAFKLNFAFFEALGSQGWSLLKEVSDEIPASKIRIADAKRGDIGNTGRFYATAIFDRLAFDACTVSPYMGRSSVLPFLQYRGKAAFVLGRTSNTDADEIQLWPSRERPLFGHVAAAVSRWAVDQPGTVGLVAGATDVEGLRELRLLCPDMPFLVPGIGAQGGQLDAVLDAAHSSSGRLVVNCSRSVIYASSGPDYAVAAGEAAKTVRDNMITQLAANT